MYRKPDYNGLIKVTLYHTCGKKISYHVVDRVDSIDIRCTSCDAYALEEIKGIRKEEARWRALPWYRRFWLKLNYISPYFYYKIFGKDE